MINFTVAFWKRLSTWYIWYSLLFNATEGISPNSLNFHSVLCLLRFHWVKRHNKQHIVILQYILWYRSPWSFFSWPTTSWSCPLVHLKKWRSNNEILHNHYKQFQRIFNGMGKCFLYKVKKKQDNLDIHYDPNLFRHTHIYIYIHSKVNIFHKIAKLAISKWQNYTHIFLC